MVKKFIKPGDMIIQLNQQFGNGEYIQSVVKGPNKSIHITYKTKELFKAISSKGFEVIAEGHVVYIKPQASGERIVVMEAPFWTTADQITAALQKIGDVDFKSDPHAVQGFHTTMAGRSGPYETRFTPTNTEHFPQGIYVGNDYLRIIRKDTRQKCTGCGKDGHNLNRCLHKLHTQNVQKLEYLKIAHQKKEEQQQSGQYGNEGQLIHEFQVMRAEIEKINGYIAIYLSKNPKPTEAPALPPAAAQPPPPTEGPTGQSSVNGPPKPPGPRPVPPATPEEPPVTVPPPSANPPPVVNQTTEPRPIEDQSPARSSDESYEEIENRINTRRLDEAETNDMITDTTQEDETEINMEEQVIPFIGDHDGYNFLQSMFYDGAENASSS